MERVVQCCVAAGCTNSRKSYASDVSISKDPQAKKRVGIANKEDNHRDVCVVRATTTDYNASY